MVQAGDPPFFIFTEAVNLGKPMGVYVVQA